VPLRATTLKHPSLKLKVAGGIDVADPQGALQKLKLDHSAPPVPKFFTGGENAAQKRLNAFASRAVAGYADGRNEPASDQTSHMSAYLHFGQVSPVELSLRIKAAKAGDQADVDSYLEELIVRRELAINYCEFTENYDSYDALPGWAKKTLADHAADPRPHLYSAAELESAQTSDPYWNAAQR
jgi:deoxyribodipyrimidine photo-lyase